MPQLVMALMSPGSAEARSQSMPCRAHQATQQRQFDQHQFIQQSANSERRTIFPTIDDILVNIPAGRSF